jgi:hypothetical protein
MTDNNCFATGIRDNQSRLAGHIDGLAVFPLDLVTGVRRPGQ